MTRNGVRFRLGTIPVTVRAGFLLLVTLAVVAHLARPVTALVLLVMLPLSVGLHELAHAWVAGRYGAAPEVTLSFVGGHTVSDADATPRMRQQLAMVLAGPAANLLTGVLAAAALRLPFLPPDILAGRLWSPAVAIWWTTTGMGLANLLPVLPLDGGRAIKVVADRVAPSAGTALATIVSLTACGLLATYGLWERRPLALWAALLGLFANLWVGFDALRRATPVPARARRMVAFAAMAGTLAVLVPFGWRTVTRTTERRAACREAAAALDDPSAYRGDLDARFRAMRAGAADDPTDEARQDAALVVWFTRDAPDGRVHDALRANPRQRTHVPQPQRDRAIAGARERLGEYQDRYCRR